jgi:hypothetical protein
MRTSEILRRQRYIDDWSRIIQTARASRLWLDGSQARIDNVREFCPTVSNTLRPRPTAADNANTHHFELRSPCRAIGS